MGLLVYYPLRHILLRLYIRTQVTATGSNSRVISDTDGNLFSANVSVNGVYRISVVWRRKGQIQHVCFSHLTRLDEHRLT